MAQPIDPMTGFELDLPLRGYRRRTPTGNPDPIHRRQSRASCDAASCSHAIGMRGIARVGALPATPTWRCRDSFVRELPCCYSRRKRMRTTVRAALAAASLVAVVGTAIAADMTGDEIKAFT
jgi:hypothetical protein